jgi:hypothetical protein
LKKNKLIVAAAVTAVVGAASLTGMQLVSAQSNNPADGNNLIQKIAQKFNLKPADVKAVFDQNQAEHQAARQQKITDELTQAVKDGKLTEAQKQLILSKLTAVQAQMQANRDSLNDKTPAERKAAMDAQKADLEAWAKTNNIPTDYLRFIAGHGRQGRMMHQEAEPNEPNETN